MAKVIWKFSVAPGDFTHEVPSGARVLSVQLQGTEPVMWVLVDPEMKKVTRRFCTVPTGLHSNDLESTTYVGTFQMVDGLVFHLFVEPEDDGS